MSDQTPLIAAPKKRGRLYAIIVATLVVVIAIVVGIFIATNNSNAAPKDAASNAITEGKGSTADPVKIGVVGASDPYWADYTEAAAAEGISVEVIDFASYELPNPALTEGELDLNQFQHIVYLAQYNEAAGEDLTPIGATAIYPLALYSTQYDSSAGLIELKDGGTIFATLDDIDSAKSRVTVTALEAALAPTSLPDVAAAIINNDFVADAGLEFSDAIATDDPSDPNALPYANIFAAQAGDADNELFQRLVDIYQSTTVVQDGVLETSGGTAVLLQTPADDLVASLAKVQSDIRAQG